MDIAVLGAGSWGTAMAIHLNSMRHNVCIWTKDQKQLEEIQKTGYNKKYLDVRLPESIGITTDIEYALENKKIVVMAVPSHAVRSVVERISGVIDKESIIVNLAKGLETSSLKRMSQVIKEMIDNPVVVLSGPSHAEEVCKHIPTACVISSDDINACEYVQDVMMDENFRLYINKDLIGVELGGSLKNIIALGAGISDGLGFGDNTKAALMTRGLAEITRLGVALGSDPLTFLGLTGMGDLIVTCTSMYSRNRRAGIKIGQGKSLNETLDEIGMVVEGVNTTKSAYKLSKMHNIEMPITCEIYSILFEGKDPREAVYSLMTRNKKHEMEDI
ncbi:MAG: glycerol-3-phosphate dehydrogenase [Thermoanaerobacterium sp.]|uniref:NAD(P)H-dependent glycerol-3-phosphate dehydrogenase n=1 Tax=Thermoanaerobacterium sp. CMT5567-10 TaxID=3061989 RepID=UPI0024AA1BF9|nr:NAD(P)H-dependent glycerol-3-phosphate dehydrogenase [Thermoanaerobacterium sp. CMT5567-10]MDI3476584.1 glycerol-3-phosphate dehydrogenase [Thermoanaerobacterium sp.]MDK2805087.1 glycerol-3-phosphate dehydrogenase [Thermoanaerobacterium sp.]MDN5316521.1 glycerol-3-phosphate dehydrogenase [Thermoanaerobacterium sp.]WKV09353.1 NAD(P)H-dependent glycerol-3-phosphate dehydrogenase [Thermoanaerobacterium sp. CMT5567-10]